MNKAIAADAEPGWQKSRNGGAAPGSGWGKQIDSASSAIDAALTRSPGALLLMRLLAIPACSFSISIALRLNVA